MQPIFIALMMLITGGATLVILYFLGNFQQLQRNRINRTPRVSYLPKIETVLNESPTPLNTEADISPTEVTENHEMNATSELETHKSEAEHSEHHSIENHDKHSEHPEGNEHNEAYNHNLEEAKEKKKKWKNWWLGGEIMD